MKDVAHIEEGNETFLIEKGIEEASNRIVVSPHWLSRFLQLPGKNRATSGIAARDYLVIAKTTVYDM